jgi:hypothetical protein
MTHAKKTNTEQRIAQEFTNAFNAWHVRQRLVQEFTNSIELIDDHYALRSDAPFWVRKAVNDTTTTNWDREICYNFAEVWAERGEDAREEVVMEFADDCIYVYTWRAIEWLTEDVEHMASADDYLDNYSPSFKLDSTREILHSLASGGQYFRADSIAQELWDMLEEQLRHELAQADIV